MMWDPRAQKPLYSLPIAWSDDIAWIPTKIPRLRPPNAINNWVADSARSAWSKLEEDRGKGDGTCCIM